MPCCKDKYPGNPQEKYNDKVFYGCLIGFLAFICLLTLLYSRVNYHTHTTHTGDPEIISTNTTNETHYLRKI